MRKILLIPLLFLPDFASATLGSDTALLSSILSQTTAQLTELKNILEIQSTTLDQVEKMNNRVQQVRYRLLRAKYLVEASQNLASSNVQSSQEVLRLMRNAKNLKNDTVHFGQDQSIWIEELSKLTPEEKQQIINQIEQQEKELLATKEYLNDKKLALQMKKKSNSISQERMKLQNQNLERIVQENESSSSSDMDQRSAITQTAKNTGLTNTILYKQMAIDNEILKEAQGINDKLEKLEIEKLEREQRERALWQFNKN